jgi:hypothetical protein
MPKPKRNRPDSRKSRGSTTPAPPSPISAIPGYGEISPESLRRENVDGDASVISADTASRLLAFLKARDPVALLAKSGEQLLREMRPGEIGPGPSGLEQVHVEFLQAFAIAAGTGRSVPASPKSMVRLWGLAQRNLAAYLTMTDQGADADEAAHLARRVRMRTVFYRNIFNSDDAAQVLPALFARMDTAAERGLGFRTSDFAKALFQIFNEVGRRFYDRIEVEEVLRAGTEPASAVQTMLHGSHWAKRLWRYAEKRPLPLEGIGWAGFQLAEMLCATLFTFSRADLVARFGAPITDALFSRSMTFGSIAEADLPHIYLANPIWDRPFIAIDANTLFIPLPVLIVSFPFRIIEGLLGSDAKLNKAYSDARTHYLEDDVERIVRLSLPSAAVYAGVTWTDPDTRVLYEHDVVAVIGMQVLIFEAKSGKLAAAARRGGLKSLMTNFKELFVKPGQQAARLQALLATHRDDVQLTDRKGGIVRFERSGPSVVHKFGVCIEQFASVTSSRRPFREMGLLTDDQEWAPILTLAELRMISDRLDTELSFLHYMTRRFTADDVLDFVADEQDLLSMYLMNGFVVDTRALDGRQVTFLQADGAVRGRASPRSDRREFATPGIKLPPMWALIAKEVYADDHRHRFDILLAILNQVPPALEGMAATVRRWRSGAGKGAGNTLSAQTVVGDRVFVVAIHMARDHPADGDAWANQSRFIGLDLADKLGATDCVVILKSRRSRSPTFDGVSFFRFPAG